ncbi:MAG: hypothetical protein JSV49_04280 [Thermoplasmata archaeon]|nr:MAG: hypothetical protein JSV49_04280 [Thermoplasmata archaeon]
MGITRFPNGISSMASPINHGTYLTTGSVYYVDSNTGSNDYTGEDPEHPVADIETAIAKCSSGLCDTIFLMPNHAETISSSTECMVNKSGIRVIGLGTGLNRPTFTLDTGTGSQIHVTSDAHSAWLENLYVVAGVDDLQMPFHIEASDVTLKDIEYTDAASMEAAQVVVSSSAGSRGLTIDGFIIRNATDVTGAADDKDFVFTIPHMSRCEIKNCFLITKTTSFMIASCSGGTTGERVNWIHDNYLCNLAANTGLIGISSNAVQEFIINDNYLRGDSNSTAAVADLAGAEGSTNVWLFRNKYVSGDGEIGADILNDAMAS